MPPRAQKLVSRAALALIVVFCGVWLGRLDYDEKISTNVLDLIPTAEQSPEVDLIRGFASDVQSRVMLFVLQNPKTPDVAPQAAAERFATELLTSGHFAEAVVMGNSAAQDELGRKLFERRFELLLPSWLNQRQREFDQTGQPSEQFSMWLAERVASDLEAFLSEPEAAALQKIIPADPLLLVARLIETARLAGPAETTGGYGLIWARMKASPLEEAGQQPVFTTIDRALANVRALDPGLELRWAGVNRFAAASRARIESEIQLLNIFSIAAVLAISAIFIRRIHKILHLLPVILLSIAGAWTASTLVFDRLHVLVFVIGSLLSGVAVDYGVYIYMQPYLSEDESYVRKLRRLLKPLLASCLTTVVGFSLLLFSDLPLIRQIGLFVGSGLLCALAVAMLYFAQLDRPLLEGRQFGGFTPRSHGSFWRWLPRLLFIGALLVAVIGPWRLDWRDDIRQLEIPTPALQANETAVRSHFGDSAQRSVYLTYGSSVREARENLDTFLQYQARVNPGAGVSSLGVLIPTEQDWRDQPARLRALSDFPAQLRASLERHGFSAASFSPFFEAWSGVLNAASTPDYSALATSVTEMLTGPLSLLSSSRTPFWFATLVAEPVVQPVPKELHTVSVNQLQSLNELFTRYRWSALRLSVTGLGLVIFSVFLIYPFRRALRIALIPAGSCFFVFGVFGLMGQTLNLFHLLGAFLGVCLSHNYAIFSSENTLFRGAPPVAIRLSALSTAASFGVLAFSQIPVIHALGLTVAAIVVTALAAVELESSARRPAP